MDARHRLLDRSADPEVGGAGIFRVNPALHTDFGGAAIPGLLDPPPDLREIEVIGPAAQVFGELTLGKGTELASEIADIGVVNVAGHDIADHVAIDPLPQLVGRAAYRVEFPTARREEPDYLRFVERLSGRASFQDRHQLPFTLPLRGPLPLPTKVGRGASGILPRPACGERVGVRGYRGRRLGTGARHPIVRAGKALGVDRAQHCRAQRRVEPALGSARVSRVDRQPPDKRFAGCGGLLGQPIECRPRSLRVDVIGGDRRDAAPIVDAGGDHLGERTGVQVGRRLDVHLRAEDQARDSDGPEVIVELRLRRLRHPRPRLGPKILDDDLLHMAIAVVQIAQRQQRLDALAPGLADADQDAGGERHRRLAGGADGFKPYRRILVGRAEMRPAAAAQPLGRALQHDALRHRHRAQPVDVDASHDPRVEMRQQAGLAQHQLRHFGEVREGGLVTEPRQRFARRAVP